ncbi:MAG TPA: PstS family phosphate ABC transporter substrate-binding protein [Gaiellaceae bacterium]|nr:PstS family phosphate ABC transporter substrate-binding protein [Gaiellaceae bacterium]
MGIRPTPRLTLLLMGLILALGAAACGGDDDGGDVANSANTTEDANEDLSGTIRIDGSSTVAPLSEAAAELFMQENPNVRVTVGTSGTGGGFEKFCVGETDISDASRPIKDEEAAICEENGIAFEEVTVANDALSVMVNLENPVDCLSVEQLNQIWGPDSTLSSWSEVDGLEPAFGEPLELYGPGTDSGTFDYFTEAINGEEGAQRTDYNNIGEDDNTGIVGVEGTIGGMFYAGFSYYTENANRVKALQIDGGGGCVEPAVETVQDGSYAPLARPLFIYPSDTALARPEVLAFLEFYIENEQAIAEAVGFVDLTDEQQQEANDKVASLAGG